MLIPCSQCDTTNKIPWVPDDKTPLKCRQCGHHFTSEYVLQHIREINEANRKMTIQQEADLAQAAFGYTQDLRKACTEPQRFIENFVLELMETALRGAYHEAAKESRLEIETQAEALDAAEFALNSLVSLSCNCLYVIDDEGVTTVQHVPLCTVLIAQNALNEIKEKLGKS